MASKKASGGAAAADTKDVEAGYAARATTVAAAGALGMALPMLLTCNVNDASSSAAGSSVSGGSPTAAQTNVPADESPNVMPADTPAPAPPTAAPDVPAPPTAVPDVPADDMDVV